VVTDLDVKDRGSAGLLYHFVVWFVAVSHILRRPHALALLCLTALAGCGFPYLTVPPTLAKTEETTQFVRVPSRAAWVNAPTAMVVTERGLVDSREQRIGLPNTTTVTGDNVLILRARKPGVNETGRLVFGEFMKRVGDAPAPFAGLEPGELRSAEDGLGTYLWAEKRMVSGAVCVLALRRMTNGTRQLPGNYQVVDAMLRNCVDGSVEEALRPMTTSYIGYRQGDTGGAPQGASRMLSPLAAPTPR
jgi:hypothetical protein